MTRARKIREFLSAIIRLAAIYPLVMYPDHGYRWVILFLNITLLLSGFRLLVYYFTMARYMVDGIMTFYKSIILIDFGLFIFSLQTVPKRYAMLYLVGTMIFTGLLRVMQARESRKLGNLSWRYNMGYGIFLMVVAFTGVIFMDSVRELTLIYCLGLASGAVSCFINIFHKTEMMYVES